MNPFRYRGYYYDVETGFYYCNARYYDPVIGRWLSPDNVEYLGADGAIGGYNRYSYCGNDPVNRVDPEGELWWFLVGIIVGAVLGGALTFAQDARENGVSWKSFTKAGISAAFGALSGIVAASGVGVVGACIIGAAMGGTETFLHELIDHDGDLSQINYINVAIDGAFGLIAGAIGGKGAIRGDKYMHGHISKFFSNVPQKGFQQVGSIFRKNTWNYSKKFIGSTHIGVMVSILVATAMKHAYYRLDWRE